jgi:hypothetical protein
MQRMYYILKTDTMWGVGGESTSVTIYKKSTDKKVLEQIMLDLFDVALRDENVELINSVEKVFVNDPDYSLLINGDLVVQYFSDGQDYSLERYNLVKEDEEADVDTAELKRLKEERNRFLTIAYNAICLGQLDEQYSEEHLLKELGCSQEEYDAIME